MNFKSMMLAAGLVVAAATPAAAQGCTDCPGPGSGPSMTGTVVFIPPSLSPGFPGSGSAFVTSPAGGSVSIPMDVLGALRGAINNGSADGRSTLVTAFGGSTQAGTLADALATLGATRTTAALAAALRAYNEAVTSASEVTPGLIAARAFLAGAYERGTR